MRVWRLPTKKLEKLRDEAADKDDWELVDRCDEELAKRRDEDEPHPDTPALDPPWWEYR